MILSLAEKFNQDKSSVELIVQYTFEEEKKYGPDYRSLKYDLFKMLEYDICYLRLLEKKFDDEDRVVTCYFKAIII